MCMGRQPIYFLNVYVLAFEGAVHSQSRPGSYVIMQAGPAEHCSDTPAWLASPFVGLSLREERQSKRRSPGAVMFWTLSFRMNSFA